MLSDVVRGVEFWGHPIIHYLTKDCPANSMACGLNRGLNVASFHERIEMVTCRSCKETRLYKMDLKRSKR